MRLIFSLRFFLLTFAFCSYTTISAQTLLLTVRDEARKPMPGATIQLTNLSDSTSLYTVTELNGKAGFENLSVGLYRIKITYVGYITLERNLNIKDEKQYQNYTLKESVQSLEAVTVTATRPLVRQEGDKMIIDPEPIAATSNNSLEVLESTPGLFVDQDGGVYLNSITPAAVYINGKEQKLSPQDITNLLRSIPPESIERIEVLRSPGTKYDASSSGGIINIVLKQGVKLGRFGSASLGMSQGVYGNHSAGVNFNNSFDKATYYLNANYSFNDGLEELNSIRMLATDTQLTQSARNRSNQFQAFLGYGLAYDISEKLVFNYDGRINANRRTAFSKNINQIDDALSARLIESDNFIDNSGFFMNVQQDFSLKYKLDTLDSEWETRFSYAYTSNGSEQDYRTELIFPLLLTSSGEGDNTQNRHFFTFQTDVSYNLPFKVKLETGLKTAWQLYSSKADFFKTTNGSAAADPQRTNSFSYRDGNNAAYLQASRPLIFKFELKAGLRVEQTYMNGQQTIPSDTGFLVNRTDLFPYVFLSRPVFKIADVSLQAFMIYRRTISRPGYQNLNPYVRFVDQFMYETGNPALKPQFTDNYEINISFNDMPVFAVGRNYTTDIFTSVIYKDKTQPGVAVRTYDNLGKSKETYFRAMAGIPPGGRYFFALGSQYNLNDYDGFYENQPWQYSRGSWRFFTFHSLKLFKETRLTAMGFMMVNGNYGFFELKDFGAMNLGIRQNLLNNRMTITFNARDVLRTMVTHFELNQGSIPSSGWRYADNQRFGINIRYSFGLSKKEERKMMPEMEE